MICEDYLQAMFLPVLLMVIPILPAKASCHGIFCLQPIDQATCTSPSTCATLYFYDADFKEIAALQGEGKRIKHRGQTGIRRIHSVRQVGLGCYKLFSGPRHNKAGQEVSSRSTHYQEVSGLGGTVKWVREEVSSNLDHSLARSVQYNLECKFPAGALVEWLVPVLGLVVVVGCGLGIYLWIRYDKHE